MSGEGVEVRSFWPEGLNLLYFLLDGDDSGRASDWPCEPRRLAAKHVASERGIGRLVDPVSYIAASANSARDEAWKLQPSARVSSLLEKGDSATTAAARALILPSSSDTRDSWFGCTPDDIENAASWWSERQLWEMALLRAGEIMSAVAQMFIERAERHSRSLSLCLGWISCDEPLAAPQGNGVVLLSSYYLSEADAVAERLKALIPM